MSAKDPNAPGIIYKVTNLQNNMPYIGQTINTTARRMNEHIRDARNQRGGPDSLQEAIRLYVDNNFNKSSQTSIKSFFLIEQIDEGSNHNELCMLEKYYINHFDSMSPTLGGIGYNLNEGGQASGGGGLKSTTVCGTSFASWAAACRHYNHDENTPRNRIKAGWSIDDAFTVRPQPFDKSQPTIYKDQIFPSLNKLCLLKGISQHYKAVHNRIHNYHETAEQAVDYFLNRNNTLTVDGVTYKSIPDAYNNLGSSVGLHTVMHRIRVQSMSLKEALRTPRKLNQFSN